MSVADHPQLGMLDVPALVCGADGRVSEWNEALMTLLGASEAELDHARVDVHGRRGLLALGERAPRWFGMTPLTGGGWLGTALPTEVSGTAATVSVAVARRMRRLEVSIAANAAMGLMEQPDAPVAACLRELLAASQELGLLTRQLESLGGAVHRRKDAVCLRALAREAAEALSGSVTVEVGQNDGDTTAEVERAGLFTHVVALLQSLAEYVAPSGTGPDGSPKARVPGTGRALRVAVLAGDPTRLEIVVPEGAEPPQDDPVLEDARAFVAGQGGRLLVIGTRVVLELPSFGGGVGAPSAARPGAPASRGAVLVVDDDASALAMMAAVLRRSGWRVILAENGVAASVLLRQHAPEIAAIVADAVLPGRSGVELAAEARRIAPSLPVLLVSGHPTDLLGDGGLHDVPLLSKPFGARALAERVRRLIDHDEA
jgi:CheY-like chemotaxis protein